MSAPEFVDGSLFAVVEPDLGDAVVVTETEQVDGVVDERRSAVAVSGHAHVRTDVRLAAENLDQLDVLATIGRVAGALQEVAHARMATMITRQRMNPRHVQDHRGFEG